MTLSYWLLFVMYDQRFLQLIKHLQILQSSLFAIFNSTCPCPLLRISINCVTIRALHGPGLAEPEQAGPDKIKNGMGQAENLTGHRPKVIIIITAESVFFQVVHNA